MCGHRGDAARRTAHAEIKGSHPGDDHCFHHYPFRFAATTAVCSKPPRQVLNIARGKGIVSRIGLEGKGKEATGRISSLPRHA